MIRLRSIAGLLLALVLGVSSVTMAVARGHAAAQGTAMVICTGYGLVTVTLDAQGNPTGPVHPCPDCVAGMAALAVAPAVVPVLALRRGRAARAMARPVPVARPRRARRARGPPGPA